MPSFFSKWTENAPRLRSVPVTFLSNSNSNFEFATKRGIGPNHFGSNFSSQTVLEMGGGL